MKKSKSDLIYLGQYYSLMNRRTFNTNLYKTFRLGSFGFILANMPFSETILHAAVSNKLDAGGGQPLRKLATAKGLIFGAAAGYGILSKDAEFASLFTKQCQILTPEVELKWARLQQTPDRYDFTQADWIVEFAKKNNILLHGHALVWHESLPKWFEEKVTIKNAEKTLNDYIATVAGRYAGQMHSWDVVNEALASWDNRSDGLRNTPWLKLLGPQYIEIAFRAAASADPNAMLILNQNHLEYDTNNDEQTRTATLKLLERLKKAEVPIHALGIESHLVGDESRFNPPKLRGFLRNVADLGLKILITELDVDDQKLPANVEARDKIIANRYSEYLSTVLAEQAVIAVITWGLSDRSTWLSSFKPRGDGLQVRSLPFDKDLHAKAAFHAIADAINKLSIR